ncbi:hypothetical protein E1A91_A10G157200v1 [Gossypium mustelinum]|uniref:Uncharacterized protein n=1 Tax=Gossypium mustelinum TaxID=34275 RepID=A0A5D2XM82_GOSMU|nr:hypothetical protein E1A91_A10G157200v1 [Gossypium mustelinum]
MKILEDSLVFLPHGSVLNASTLPLTFLDIYWFGFPPMQRLFFYDFPYPTSYFMQTVVPNLKSSLSLALQHFFPFAGNLVLPPPPQLPYIHFKDSNSVCFIAKESTVDYGHLIGDHGRRVEEFQVLLPKLQPANTSTNGNGMKKLEKSLMAIQVTVFPNAGIALGVTFNHVVADGRAFIHFMKSWAFLNRSQGDSSFLNNFPPPDFNRDLIKDPQGQLASTFVKDKWGTEELDTLPTNKLRFTFVIKRSQVELLKNWVTTKLMEENESEKLRISTFVVICAYMWVCLNKLQENETKHPSLSGDSHIVFSADCRHHLKLPPTYFGNCIEPRFATAKKTELVKEKGVIVAAKAIGRQVMELEEVGALREAEKWLSKHKEILKPGTHFISIAASPKFGVYEIDFGWGRPRKTEVAHIGSLGSISMAESREEESGVEFGLALSQEELHSFNDVFHRGLQQLQ